MNLIEHYDNLYRESIQKIKSDDYQIDNLIDAAFDNRFGMTLIVRPDSETKMNIQSFLNDLKAIEPDQYYYPATDIHVTVLSVISCFDGFDLTKISISDYVAVILKSITQLKSFKIHFKGITASPSCIMVQGFLGDDTLNDMRDALRVNFQNSNLMQTIDQRYSLQTAHSTVVRFKTKMTRIEDYIHALESYRNFDFGTSEVNVLELVYNDWYQRIENRKELYQFKLK
jgi:2'-5' RNA ligase